MTREEFEKKWKRFIVEAPLEFMKDLNSLFLPPAELDHQLDHHLDHPADATAGEILAIGKLMMFGHVIVDHNLLSEGIYATKKLVIYQPSTTIEHLIEIGKSLRDKTQTQWLPDSYFDNLSKCELRDVVVFAAQRQPQPTAEGAEDVAEDMYERAEAFLQSKDVWNHPYISDRENKTGYEVTFLIAEFAALTADKIVEEKLRELTPSNEIINAAAKAWAKDHSEAPDKDCPEWIICDYEAGAYFVRQCYGCLNKTEVKP